MAMRRSGAKEWSLSGQMSEGFAGVYSRLTTVLVSVEDRYGERGLGRGTPKEAPP